MNNGDPSQVNGFDFTELANGNIAVSWAAAIVKDIAPGQTDGIQDVYARVFNPKTGAFITDEIKITEIEYIHSPVCQFLSPYVFVVFCKYHAVCVYECVI